SLLYGRVNSETQGFNDLLFSRINQAILGCPDGSFAGCIPYEVFTPGGVTQQAAAALSAPSFTTVKTDLLSVNAFVTGDIGFGLPWADGDNIKLVFGVEHREETYDLNADINQQIGDFAGAGSPVLPVSGKTQVSEIFLESAVPLLKDAGLLKALTLDLGYRHSDYKLSGGANTSKFGLTADFGDYRFRAGYNRAIRAPNINELFFNQQIALFGGTDPCAGATPQFTPEQCVNTGVPLNRYGTVAENSAGQYNQFIGGNPDLVPEIADTYTIGFVATPIENLQFNIDYFDIKIEDTIDAIGAPTILTFCGLTGDPFLCDRIQRAPGTLDLFRGSNPATSGFVENLNDNFGERHFRGFDVGVNYRWEMLRGRFSAGFQGTYYLEQEVAPLPGVNEDATYDCAGVINLSCLPTPEWRHIANVRYSLDPFTINLRWRYFGKVDYVDEFGEPIATDQLLAAEGGIDAQNYFDLSGSVFIGDKTELTIGVNNVFDKEPPLVGVSLSANGNANAPAGYDQLGRFIFASLDFKF
ncbi:MAG: TonB-dependent receptor domain-containing protein, partial [Burkholderiales bacterium]